MSNDTAPAPLTVQFPTLEHRTIVGMFRKSQLITWAVGLLVAVAVVVVLENLALGSLVILAAGVAGALPIKGHTVEEWVPRLFGFTVRTATGQRSWRSDAPFQAASTSSVGQRPAATRRPREFANIQLLDVDFGGCNYGFVTGVRAGLLGGKQMSTLTIVLPATAHSAALLDDHDRAQLGMAWSGAMASLAQAESPVVRAQVLFQSLPGDPSQAFARLHQHRDPAIDDDDASMVDYVGLLHREATASQDLQLYFALQVDVAACARDQRTEARDPLTRACAVAVLEAEGFAGNLNQFAEAGVTVHPPLDYAGLVHTIRMLWDPSGRRPDLARQLARATTQDPLMAVQLARQLADRTTGQLPVDEDEVDEDEAWPLALDETFGELHVDGTWHATYWVRHWPRRPVGLDVLTPLLGFTRQQFTFSVTYAPIDPEVARRNAEMDMAVDEAQEITRRTKGRVTTAKHKRQAAAAKERDEQLADGHADMLYSGYISVSAPTRRGLAEACDAVMRNAGKAHLTLERMWGEQPIGRTLTLPLCRGVGRWQ
jgi:hypothetical protein